MGRKYSVLIACSMSLLLFLFCFAIDVKACISDADCNDGFFCNGQETCVDGSCAAVSACPPAIDGCVIRGYSCDENNDVCVDFPDNSVCDVGQICDVTTGNCVGVTCGTAKLIAQEAVASGSPYKNQGAMVKTAAQSINAYLYEGVISEECHSCIVSQFARRIPIGEQEACGPALSD